MEINMMRIISGKARGIRLATLEGEATRPTSERAKEAVFSMIQFELEGREVLDLFGGSGQLGLEAVSRGAARATICDRAKPAVAVINKNVHSVWVWQITLLIPPSSSNPGTYDETSKKSPIVISAAAKA